LISIFGTRTAVKIDEHIHFASGHRNFSWDRAMTRNPFSISVRNAFDFLGLFENNVSKHSGYKAAASADNYTEWKLEW